MRSFLTLTLMSCISPQPAPPAPGPPETDLTSAALETSAQKLEPPIVHSSFGANIVWLEDIAYAKLVELDIDEDFPEIPATADHVHIKYFSTIDGHESFVRFEADRQSALVQCGPLCVSKNGATALPNLWPQADELEYPEWFERAPLGADYSTFLELEAEPYMTDMDGVETFCGYQDVVGRMWSHHAATNVTLHQRFAIQWYRVGCGG